MKIAREFAIDNFMDVESGFSFELGGLHKVDQQQVIRVMIEFAKMHCEAQLKAINKGILVNEEIQYDEYDNMHLIAKIDRDSIKNAYPLTNIK